MSASVGSSIFCPARFQLLADRFSEEVIKINIRELKDLQSKSFSKEEIAQLVQDAIANYQKHQNLCKDSKASNEAIIHAVAMSLVYQQYIVPIEQRICTLYDEIIQQDKNIQRQNERDPLFRSFIGTTPRRLYVNCLFPIQKSLANQIKPAIGTALEEHFAIPDNNDSFCVIS
ncbi:MAG: hypothetical protein ACHQUC_05745 [Chlamydiales bacterium]